jgi:replicative DNA helicase
LILVAARPAVGKTTLAQNVAYNAMLQSDARIAFFSLEMSRKQLGHRFISIDSRIDSQRLRMGQIAANLGEWDTIADTIRKLSDGHLWIDDTAGIDIDVLCSRAKRLAHKQGLDLIIVDYIGLVHATINGKRPDMTQKELSEVSGKLKHLAKDLNVPILALAQMNRSIESRAVDTVPQLSDLRDSGALEQDADIVIFLHRAKEQKSETIDLIVAKHRNGPNGQVRLGFDGKHTRFYDLNEYGEEETRR